MTFELTLEEEILFALKEAELMGENKTIDRLLEVVERLSGAPYSFVEEVVMRELGE